MEWDEWLRRVLEDLFVLDAPAVYVRKNRGGGLYGYKPLDGATINRVLDPWGDTPDTGAAYVQILKGMGAVHYTREQLIYRPRNPRNGKAFGFGPVEQIYVIINIALKRETWQLNYFTEGNLPDALIGVPMEWTPDQIRNFQDWFDARLRRARPRRGATFVPGDVAKGYVATKETELFGQGRGVAGPGGLLRLLDQPAALRQDDEPGHGRHRQEGAEEEGLDPIKGWVRASGTGLPHLPGLGRHRAWLGGGGRHRPQDAGRDAGLTVKGGLKTRNEARKVLGLDPDPSPEADMLMLDHRHRAAVRRSASKEKQSQTEQTQA
jgi:hypothetical protein